MLCVIILALLFLAFNKGRAQTKIEITIVVPPTVSESIHFFAEKYNVSVDKLTDLAKCESSMNPKAFNKNDPEGGSIGLFQFLPSTWARESKRLGETLNINSYYDQAKLTAYMISRGQIDQWACSKKI